VWLCDGAGLERVAGREVFCRNAGLDGWRADLDDCELNWRESNGRESNERVLFCCTRVELFGERETAFSRCVVRACVGPFEPREALLVLGRAKLEPHRRSRVVHTCYAEALHLRTEDGSAHWLYLVDE